MDADELIQYGVDAFDAVVAGTPGFRARPGQREMAQAAAHAFATGSLGDQDNPTRAVAVVQAGTGVGKSAAYIAPGVAIALARNTRLLIASSTVALQEQLVNKDLPALAKAMPEPFTFALAKGRARYLCRLKALRQARLAPQQAGFDLDFDPDEADGTTNEDRPMPAGAEQKVQFFRSLVEALDKGWDGDRDTLAEQPAPADWSRVSAERHTCTTRACPYYRIAPQCSIHSALAA